MKDTLYSSNPLLHSVVSKPFQRAIQDIGLPELPQDVFCKEIVPHLKGTGHPFPENEESLVKLWKSVLSGPILASELWDESIMVFYVRGGFGGTVVNLRLTCHAQEWHVQSVSSVYNRPIVQAPWFIRSVTVAAVIVAGVIGYAIHRPGVQVVKEPILPTAAATATNNTDTTNSVASSNNVDGSSNSTTNNATGTDNSTSGQPDNNTTASDASTADTSTPKTLTFDLKPGMSLHSMSVYLKDHHYIKDAVAFDMAMKKAKVDRTVKPGKYTFHAGMSQSQLINVVKKGPAKS